MAKVVTFKKLQSLKPDPKNEIDQIISVLKKTYPDAQCSLDYENPFQLLIATILSAQCTDERVNKVTPALFKKFPTPEKMSKAKLPELEKLIRSTGFYKNKAKSILESSKILVEKYNSVMPQTIEELTQLKGVGRKTANVVLGSAFGINAGVVVDTHAGRLSRRIGLTKQNDPVKVEQDLMKIVPQKDWTIFSHLLVFHGRARCPARKPDCEHCEIKNYCPKVI